MKDLYLKDPNKPIVLPRESSKSSVVEDMYGRDYASSPWPGAASAPSTAVSTAGPAGLTSGMSVAGPYGMVMVPAAHIGSSGGKFPAFAFSFSDPLSCTRVPFNECKWFEDTASRSRCRNYLVPNDLVGCSVACHATPKRDNGGGCMLVFELRRTFLIRSCACTSRGQSNAVPYDARIDRMRA